VILAFQLATNLVSLAIVNLALQVTVNPVSPVTVPHYHQYLAIAVLQLAANPALMVLANVLSIPLPASQVLQLVIITEILVAIDPVV